MKKKLRFISLIVLFLMAFSVQPPELPDYVGGVYLGGGKFECTPGIYFEYNCFHELAHALCFYRDNICESNEFKTAIDIYIEANKKDKCVGEMVCMLQAFPGLNDNPMKDFTYYQEDGTSIEIKWGGYNEAYSEIYAQWKSDWIELPKELLSFYEAN